MRSFLETTVRAKEALSQSRIRDIQRLTVHEHDGRVLLRGCVRSFYHKQIAQELVRNAIADAAVANNIRVVYHGDED
jgi:osmotically-inducible protein OsmY